MTQTAAEAEVEKIRLLEERIKAPSIWGRNPCGLRYEDLQDVRYEDAVKLLKKHYLPEDICYKSLKISEDKEGVDEFIHNTRIWMKDKMSIAVVKEDTNKLVGVLLMRIQYKNAFSRTFSRNKLTYNPKYSTVMKFLNEVEKPINMFEELKVNSYLKIYVLAFKWRYRHRGLGKEVLTAAMGLAASACIPAMAGIFTTGRYQQIATELGFTKYNEIYYIKYLIDDEVVFWDAGLGNYGAAFMGYRIPDVEEIVEVTHQASSRFQIKAIEIDDDEEDKVEKEAKEDKKGK